MNKSRLSVSITGVGYVGLTLAMALTTRGVRVIGIDRSSARVRELRNKVPGILEKGIEGLLEDAIDSGLFLPTTPSLLRSEIDSCTIHVITVGTPLVNGVMDDNALKDAVTEISKFIKDQDLVVIRSTVAVGSCRNVVLPILRDTRKSFFLAMCPERTIEGNAIEEISSLPQVVGGINKQSTEKAADFFSLLGCEIVKVDSIEESELVKLANNSFRDLTFAFSNEISALCLALGFKSSSVIAAANYNYPRSSIPMPGPASGPCLSKDPLILHQSSINANVRLRLSIVGREINEELPLNFVAARCNELYPQGGPRKVALLGLAFKGKPAVIDVRGSFALKLANWVYQRYGITCYGFEPAGPVEISASEKIQISNLKNSLEGADLVIICHNSDYFVSKSNEIKSALNSNCAIIDMWGIFKDSQMNDKFRYFSWT